MRSSILCSLSLTLASFTIGCADDTSGGGNGAGAGPSSGGSSEGGQGVGAGGPSACAEVTDISGFNGDGLRFYGQPSPALGGANPDEIYLYLAPGSAGENALTLPANAAECGMTICLVALEDLGDAGAARFYVASSGTLELGPGLVDSFYISGSLSGVELVEATIGADDSITPVEDGRCVNISSLAFDIMPPVAGWTCAPAYYDEVGQGLDAYCDCECGAVDPDCSDPELPNPSCAPGQTCSANAQCEGTPAGWTCTADQYDGGAGNGCDCNCGFSDPDCALDPPEAVEGCLAGEACNAGGLCLPAAWTCNPNYYGDHLGCDCAEAPGCGVQDPDCADAMQTVLGCSEDTDICVAGLCTAPG